MPAAPTGLAFTTVPAGVSFQLSWNEGEGAIAYRIYYGTSSGSYDNFVQVPNLLSFLVTWLVGGVSWFIVVRAWDGVEESDASNEIEVLNGIEQ